MCFNSPMFYFAFRKLAVFDTWSRLVVHVAMDNTVVIEEISEFLDVSQLAVCSECYHFIIDKSRLNNTRDKLRSFLITKDIVLILPHMQIVKITR